jgi:hypothetical protein
MKNIISVHLAERVAPIGPWLIGGVSATVHVRFRTPVSRADAMRYVIAADAAANEIAAPGWSPSPSAWHSDSPSTEWTVHARSCDLATARALMRLGRD